MNEPGVLRAEEARRGVRFERRFAAPVEEVWDALTNAERLARWLAPGSIGGSGSAGSDVQLDFGEGGIVTGRVLRCEPPSVLEYEWRFAGEAESVVRFELSPDGGGTRLVLDHRALAEEHATGYGAGWDAYLESLRDHLEGRSGSWEARFAAVLPQYRESAAALEGASLP
ncbi:MAG TPA: SRPBCC family protein [Gaiellaceae bacterium]|nr:SRPBCC family protein [Gaiellaceae bacterium]